MSTAWEASYSRVTSDPLVTMILLLKEPSSTSRSKARSSMTAKDGRPFRLVDQPRSNRLHLQHLSLKLRNQLRRPALAGLNKRTTTWLWHCSSRRKKRIAKGVKPNNACATTRHQKTR